MTEESLKLLTARPVLPIDYAAEPKWRAVDGACAILGIYALGGLPSDTLIAANTIIYMVELPTVYGGRLGQVGELLGNFGAIASYLLMLIACTTLLRGGRAKDRFAFGGCLLMSLVYALRTAMIFKQQLQYASASASYPTWRYWTIFFQAGYAILFAASEFGAAFLIKRLATRSEP